MEDNTVSTSQRRIAEIAVVVFVIAGIAVAATMGLSAEILAKFAEVERQDGLPDGILAKIAKIESNGNAKAYNASTGAAGLFQWLPSSWRDFTTHIYGQPKLQILRYDPFVAAEVTGVRLKNAENRLGGIIRQANVSIPVGLYLEHFLGENGARKFLSLYMQNPDALAAAAFPKAAKSNPGIFGSRSFSQIITLLAQKMGEPGITEVAGYNNGVFEDASQKGRIMDVPGQRGLEQVDTSPPPPPDPLDYPTDYQAILSQQSQPHQNENQNQNKNPADNTIPDYLDNQCVPRIYCDGSSVVREDSSCNTFVLQTCPNGCFGSVCVAAPSSGSQQPFPQPYSEGESHSSWQPPSPVQNGGDATPPHAFNSISGLLDVQDTRLKAPIGGNPAFEQIVTISGIPKAITVPTYNSGTSDSSDTARTDGGDATGNIHSPIGASPLPREDGTQTFTSNDLGDTLSDAGGRTYSSASLASVISALKDILIRLIAWITPR